jgi:hypothetical protein
MSEPFAPHIYVAIVAGIEANPHYWDDFDDATQREIKARLEATRIQQEGQQILEAMPYDEYLLTPHWQEFRRQALERAEYRCQVCNSGNGPLQVHHRTYERRGHERLEDVIVLCAKCHTLFHENGRLAGGAS